MDRTIKIRLPYDKRLKETIETYNKACNLTIQIAYKNKTFNKYIIHELTYKKIRKTFPTLHSSLVCASRDQASDILRRDKLKKYPTKKQHSGIRYNERTFTPELKKGVVSLSSIYGRIKINVNIPEFFEKYIDWRITGAILSFKKGCLFLYMVAKKEAPERITHKRIVGVDRGIINPVVTSDNNFFNSRHIRAVKGKYRWLRARLQSKGTRSAKRHLKHLSGREQRFMRDVNHCISKKIAESDFDVFVLEKLNVRRKKKNGKRFNTLLGTWAYRPFQEFLGYKAEALGKHLEYVSPKHTSQRCSRCGDVKKANRVGVWYRCRSCGFVLNSDLNAARNIAVLSKLSGQQAAASQPVVAGWEHRSYKPPSQTGVADIMPST